MTAAFVARDTEALRVRLWAERTARSWLTITRSSAKRVPGGWNVTLTFGDMK